jgi:hypothetical protein
MLKLHCYRDLFCFAFLTAHASNHDSYTIHLQFVDFCFFILVNTGHEMQRGTRFSEFQRSGSVDASTGLVVC